MASRKKRAVENEMKMLENDEYNDDDVNSSDEDMSENDEINNDESINEKVQVDFEARNAEDFDFHGIRKLLQQLFLKANVNLSNLANQIISQNYVGSVIKQVAPSDDDSDDDDGDLDDVFGVVSVVNLTQNTGTDYVNEFKSLLVERCTSSAPALVEKLESVLNRSERDVGFLINERFINIPPQIALPSFESLWNEVERAKTKKMKYNFSHYILIAKTYRCLPTKTKKKNKKSKQKTTAEPDRVFVNVEEELFFENAELTFDYSVKSERDTSVDGAWDDDADEMEPFRTVLIVPVDSVPLIMTKMRELLSQ